jgi:hypothetical protein
MTTARTIVFVCGILFLATAPLTWSPRIQANADIDQQLLAARESAWRSYFAGDVKTLGDLLPQEFIGIGMTDGPFTDRATTLEDARTFRERGGRLIHLAFPETRAQTFGDAVVLYGRYEVVLESEGKQQTMKGRLTEMFVRRDGKWVHPGWHLDLTP